MFRTLIEAMDIMDTNERDTVASAFLKGMTNTYVKGAMVAGILHLGIKAHEHYKKESTSEDGD